MSTLYAAFADSHAAEKAIGALLDNGANQTDISLVASHPGPNAVNETTTTEASAKTGISTTTGTDAAAGAIKGTTVGLGIGIAALAAALFIPGIGLVVGGGALASALAGVAGTAAAGAAAGGVTGYLVDQGLNEDQAARYSSTLESGGALVAISVPTGKITTEEVEGVLTKYGALNIATYNSMSAQPGIPITQPTTPLVVSKVDPVVVVTSEHMASPSPTVTRTVTTEENRITGEVRETETISRQEPSQSALVFDPLTGIQSEVVTQPVPVVVQNERITMPGQANRDMVIDPLTGQATVRIDKEVILDPITGLPVYSELTENKPFVS